MLQKIKQLLSEEKLISAVIILTMIAEILAIIGTILIIHNYGMLEDSYGTGFAEWKARYAEARSIGYTESHLYLIIFLMHLAAFITVYVRNCLYERKNIIPGVIAIVFIVLGLIFGLISTNIAAILVGIGIIALIVSCVFLWKSTAYDISRSVLIYWLISLLVTCIVIPFITTIIVVIAVAAGLVVLFVIAASGGSDDNEIQVLNRRTGEINTYVKKE